MALREIVEIKVDLALGEIKNGLNSIKRFFDESVEPGDIIIGSNKRNFFDLEITGSDPRGGKYKFNHTWQNFRKDPENNLNFQPIKIKTRDIHYQLLNPVLYLHRLTPSTLNFETSKLTIYELSKQDTLSENLTKLEVDILIFNSKFRGIFTRNDKVENGDEESIALSIKKIPTPMYIGKISPKTKTFKNFTCKFKKPITEDNVIGLGWLNGESKSNENAFTNLLKNPGKEFISEEFYVEFLGFCVKKLNSVLISNLVFNSYYLDKTKLMLGSYEISRNIGSLAKGNTINFIRN